jgi:hypothetical protein
MRSGFIPPDARPAPASRADINLRLVVQLELPLRERAPQSSLELEPLPGKDIHERCEELKRASPVLLGVIHRRVGVL